MRGCWREWRPTVAIVSFFTLLAACGDDPNGPSEDDGLEEIPVTWTQVTLGKGGFSDFACGLADDGAAYCWGVNSSGQLGDGDERPVGVPRPVLGGLSFSSLEAGWHHTCGLALSGRTYCWGAASIEESNAGTGPKQPQVVPGNTTFETLAAHNFRTCGLTSDGSARCWTGSDATPEPLPGGHQFSMISLGANFGCGVRVDGAGLCWGSNNGNQLGNGTQESSEDPIPVAGDIEFVTVSSGGEFSCGLDGDGVVYCWGSITQYAPFDEIAGGIVPTAVPTHERFVQVSVANRHACALRADGAAFCWGEGSEGQLGDGTNVIGRNGPVAVVGGLSFVSITAGGVNTCGVTPGGEIWCWGSDGVGQLGRGTDVVAGDVGGFSSVPVRVLNPRG